MCDACAKNGQTGQSPRTGLSSLELGRQSRPQRPRSGAELGETAGICVKSVELGGKLWRERDWRVIKIAAKPACLAPRRSHRLGRREGLKASAEAGIAKASHRQ